MLKTGLHYSLSKSVGPRRSLDIEILPMYGRECQDMVECLRQGNSIKQSKDIEGILR
jgi:hypothetical protein